MNPEHSSVMNPEEQFYPLGNDIYLTKCTFHGQDYFHIRKFVFIQNAIRPTKTGVVLTHKQLRCLKNTLNRLFLDNQDLQTVPTVPAAPTCDEKPSEGYSIPPSFKEDCSDNELVKAAIEAEKRLKLESRFFY